MNVILIISKIKYNVNI